MWDIIEGISGFLLIGAFGCLILEVLGAAEKGYRNHKYNKDHKK